MRSHFNKIHTNRIFIKLIPQKQIVCANVKIERNFNKQFQRWFPFSTLYIAEMFETDVEFFSTFLLCLTSGFTKCFQTPCKISFPYIVQNYFPFLLTREIGRSYTFLQTD